jgi:hypothetical protein
MLLELKVSDFAVIESMRVNFLRPGLNVLSGETGAGKRYVNEYLSDDNVVYFKHYQERLLGGTTPNENIENKLWIECEIQEDSSFSYNGVSHTGKKGFKQIKYPLGHDGLAVNFCSGYGDGTYDVFAKIKNGRNWEIKIVLISEKDENYE